MAFVAIAIGGAALIGAGASIIGGNKAANAQKDAANQATALQQDQNAEARRQYDQNRTDLAPYRAVGTGALGKLSNLMGVGTQQGPTTDWAGYVGGNPQAKAAYDASQVPAQTYNLSDYFGGGQDWMGGQGFSGETSFNVPQDASSFGQSYYNSTGKAAGHDISSYTTTPSNPADFGSLDRSFTLADFNKDPGYEFRRSEGQRGVESSAAARGGILSGGALKALARYNQDAASGEYGAAYNRFNNDNTTRFNRLSALAGTGQTATNSSIAAGNTLMDQQQAGVNNITSNINAAGNARASQYAGTANAIGSAANNVGQYFAMKNLYKPPSGTGGYGGGSGQIIVGGNGSFGL